jgi:gliding motility-associated lipoprotein GldH
MLAYKKVFFILFILSFFVFLYGCDTIAFYEKNYDLKKGGWHEDSIFVFKLNIEDTETKYNFYYNLRSTQSYPFYNLYVTYYLEDAKGNLVKTELQNITLFDVKTGKPFGNGIGGIYSHQLLNPSLTQFKFKQKGQYFFKIKQYMRKSPLEGIQTVGLRVEKAEN